MVISAPGSAARSARKAGVVQRKSPIREARSNTILRGGSERRDSRGRSCACPDVNGLIMFLLVPGERTGRSIPAGDRGHVHRPCQLHSKRSWAPVSTRYLKARWRTHPSVALKDFEQVPPLQNGSAAAVTRKRSRLPLTTLPGH